MKTLGYASKESLAIKYLCVASRNEQFFGRIGSLWTEINSVYLKIKKTKYVEHQQYNLKLQ